MNPILNESDDAFQDLPEALQMALKQFVETRSESDLNRVIIAVLNDLSSEPVEETLLDATNFIEDLGLDSLAIAEFVFFFEDIFKIKITNDSLVQMRTLGELKAFLKAELA